MYVLLFYLYFHSFAFPRNCRSIYVHFSFLPQIATLNTLPQVALDTANPAPYTILSRLILTTSTGSIQLWHQGNLEWVREEALSEIGVAEFVELPPEGEVGTGLEREEGFVERLRRQLGDAQVSGSPYSRGTLMINSNPSGFE
jgi:ER membrane protein complex subunit 1